MATEITTIAAAKCTLVDQSRDMILEILRDMKKGFDDLGEVQEGIVIEKVSQAATRIVLGCCDVIAADGRELLDCSVGNVTAHKTTFEAKISVGHDTPGAMSLVRAAHGAAKIAFVNTDQYIGEETRPEARPDQGDMLKETSDTAEAIKAGIKAAAVEAPKKFPGMPDPKAIKAHMEKAEKAIAEEFPVDPEVGRIKTANQFIEEEAKAAKAKPASKAKPKTAPRRRVTRGTATVKGKNGKPRDVDVETKKARKAEAAASFELPEDTYHDETLA